MEKKPLIAFGWLRALLFFIFFWGMHWLVSKTTASFFHFSAPKQEVENGVGFTQLWPMVLVGLVASLISVILFRKWVDRASFYSLGFNFKHHKTHAVTGFFSALAVLCLATLFLLLTGNLQLFINPISLYALLLNAVLMAVVAFYEELVFRGYLLNNLLQRCHKWVALLAASLCFAWVHSGNNGATDGWLPLIAVFIGGVMLGINYIYTKNLWFGIFLHFGWNFFQGPVLGYQVSGIHFTSVFEQQLTGSTLLTGGAFGFEASLLGIGLNVLLILILVAIYQKKFGHK